MSFELIDEKQSLRHKSIQPKQNPGDKFKVVIPIIENTENNSEVLDVTLVELQENQWCIEKIENENKDYYFNNDEVAKINDLYNYLAPQFEEMLKHYKLKALLRHDGLDLSSPVLVQFK